MVVQTSSVPVHKKGRRPSRSTPFLVRRYKAQRLFVDLAGADGSLLAVGGGKQALAQAIMLKRQKIQADAISALDERTNEMLLKNARNTVEQAKITTRLASGSSIKADTLETTWRTIMTGLDETKKIQESARTQRAQDQAKLEAIKKDFMSRYNMPNR